MFKNNSNFYKQKNWIHQNQNQSSLKIMFFVKWKKQFLILKMTIIDRVISMHTRATHTDDHSEKLRIDEQCLLIESETVSVLHHFHCKQRCNYFCGLSSIPIQFSYLHYQKFYGKFEKIYNYLSEVCTDEYFFLF